jgi:hypothetical protein
MSGISDTAAEIRGPSDARVLVAPPAKGDAGLVTRAVDEQAGTSSTPAQTAVGITAVAILAGRC